MSIRRPSEPSVRTVATLTIALLVAASATVAATGGVAAADSSAASIDQSLALQSTDDQTVTGTSTLDAGTNLTVRVRASGEEPFRQSRQVAVDENATFSATFDLDALPVGTEATVEVLQNGTTLDEVTAPIRPAYSGFYEGVHAAAIGEEQTVTLYLASADTAQVVIGNDSAVNYELTASVADDGDGVVKLAVDTGAMGTDETPVTVTSEGDSLASVSQSAMPGQVDPGDYPLTLRTGESDAQAASGTLVLTEPVETTATTTTTATTDQSTTTDQPSSTTSASTPGFGALVALLSVVGAGLVALRRRE